MKVVKELFNQVASKLGYETMGRPAIKKDYIYALDWLILDHNNVYGGYVINIVGAEHGGYKDFDGFSRRSNREMVAYLRGLLKGLELQKKLDK